MEDWKLDFEWLKLRHELKEQFQKAELPNLNAILFLIGIQELGKIDDKFTKEQKQDLMHIAVCRLLSQEGYYEFEGLDDEGWPHWKKSKLMPALKLKEQELLLKRNIVRYFKEIRV